MTADPASMVLSAFELASTEGPRAFPTGRPALLCFVKEDCPTCDMTMPLIEAAHRAFGAELDVLVIGQEAAGNAVLVTRHGLTAPMLDDSALQVSYAYDLDTVPTIILAGGDGTEETRFIGFGRDDWRNLVETLVIRTGLPAPSIDWSSYPESRPGCGSRSVEPGIAERLEAEASGSPLRARRIEVADQDDEFEFMFDQGLTDGLPVIPPTPARVLRMLRGTRRDAQEVVAVVPPNLADATVEKVAINAVMAGCRPEYLPVVIAALEAVCTDEFNAHGVLATTMGCAPLLVVNGPIRHRIGMNMGLGALGPGNRANATIGRALMLTLRNVGGAQPGGIERSTFSAPTKYTMAFAEWEERSPWAPLHVERGFRADQSVVTAFGVVGGPHQIVDQTSRSGDALAGSIAVGLESAWHPKAHRFGDALLVVGPEHLETLVRGGYDSKDTLRQRIQEVTSRPLGELLSDDRVGGGAPLPRDATAEALARPVPKFSDPSMIHIVVAGAEAGKWSTYFAGWQPGAGGTVPTSRIIEE